MIRRKRRKKAETSNADAEPAASEPPGGDADAPADTAPQGRAAQPPVAHAAAETTAGPHDVADVDERDAEAASRLDLGALQLPLLEELEVRVEVDPESEEPVAVTAVRGEGAVQLRAFAAPKSGGSWEEARAEIRRSLSADGGTVDEVDGDFGTELRASIPATDEQGRRGVRRLRIVGVDGPRWMVQAVMLGAGAVPEDAEMVEEVLRSVVVVRGESPMPPGAPLPIRLPEDAEPVEDE